MAYRTKISKARARKSFRRTANRTHKLNRRPTRPKRGGFRL